MFNIGSGELALIAVVALLILGPKRLPELARGIGKFMREFRRQTDEVRGVVEREFYKMDQELPHAAPPRIAPAPDSLAVSHAAPAPTTSEHPQTGASEHPRGASEHPQVPPSPMNPAGSEAPSADGTLPPVTEDVRSQVLSGAAPGEPVSLPVPSPDEKR